jgi:hypothetical protein
MLIEYDDSSLCLLGRVVRATIPDVSKALRSLKMAVTTYPKTSKRLQPSATSSDFAMITFYLSMITFYLSMITLYLKRNDKIVPVNENCA